MNDVIDKIEKYISDIVTDEGKIEPRELWKSDKSTNVRTEGESYIIKIKNIYIVFTKSIVLMQNDTHKLL
jgi:hypothetical protein